MLEKMGEFFDNRVDGYEAHQLNTIESAQTFYPFTAQQLPMTERAKVLDLGCGTGLELGYYFALNSTARVTGVDLAKTMLQVLQEKFADRDLTVIRGSYFDVPLETGAYDAVVSVESLHHFTQAEKLRCMKRCIRRCAPAGIFC